MASQTVTAVFDRYSDAAAAVSKLEAAGVSHSAISMVSNDQAERARHSGSSSGALDDQAAKTGAGTGATLGTTVGAGAGLLAGLGLLAIPGLGPVVAAGWLVSTLVGAGVGAATGGLLGSLTGAGISDSDAHSYAEAVHRGGTLVTVRADEGNHARVVSLLDADGAVDMTNREASWRSEGWSGQYAGAAGTGATAALGGAAARVGDAVTNAASAVGSATGLSSPSTGGYGTGSASTVGEEATRRNRVRSYPL